LRFGHSVERLTFYLGLFRARSGARAQFGASLVCFELARRGSAVAQREFTALAPTMNALRSDGRLVDDLLAADPLLHAVWVDCQTTLELNDPREAFDPLAHGTELVGVLDLLLDEEVDLGDAELELIEAEVDDPQSTAAHAEFGALLLRHLRHEPEKGVFQWGAGFATSTRGDLVRLESFLNEAASRAGRVPAAAGLACLGNLFLAMHLRRHTLFGKPTPRRVAALKSGLLGLPVDCSALGKAAAVFEFEGKRVQKGFEKVLELLMDFLVFCNRQGLSPREKATVEAYVAADRQAPQVLLVGDIRRR
jgi:hypothetical protein